MITTKMIGNKIAEARKKVNISQSQLAQRLFISSQAVGKWERGESMPDIITLNRLAEILEVNLNFFSENAETVATDSSFTDNMEKQPDKVPNVNKSLTNAKSGKKLNWDMSRGNWLDADFSGLKNLHEKFSSSNMLRCKFIGSDLSELLLKNNNIDSCDFSSSDFSRSQIQNSNLSNNLFKNCTLKDTEFIKSYLSACDFNAADFSGVKFKSGGFSGIFDKSNISEKNTIADAIWQQTSFIDTYIADIVFTGKMKDCYFENCGFKRVIFRNATLLNTFFKNKSLKGIKFIDCKADRMTYEFLKNGKADLKGIALLTA